MPDKIVELKSGRRPEEHMPETTPWFVPLEQRVSLIERMVARLEWQVWIILCGVAALVLIAVLDALGA